jgi:hypothetical protein
MRLPTFLMRLPTYAWTSGKRMIRRRVRWPEHKLWDMGIRGRMWQNVDALYARLVRVVRVEKQVS